MDASKKEVTKKTHKSKKSISTRAAIQRMASDEAEVPQESNDEGKQPEKEEEETETTLNWIQCDKCSKWRVVFEHEVVDGSDPDAKWACSMNTTDPNNNSCDASEKDQAWYEAELSRRKKDAGVDDNDGGDDSQEKKKEAEVDVKFGENEEATVVLSTIDTSKLSTSPSMEENVAEPHNDTFAQVDKEEESKAAPTTSADAAKSPTNTLPSSDEKVARKDVTNTADALKSPNNAAVSTEEELQPDKVQAFIEKRIDIESARGDGAKKESGDDEDSNDATIETSHQEARKNQDDTGKTPENAAIPEATVEEEKNPEARRNASDERADEVEDASVEEMEGSNVSKAEAVVKSSKAKQGAHHAKRKKQKNSLTHVLPGYTAPMRLATSWSARKQGEAGGSGLESLRRQAMREDTASKQAIENARVMAARSTTGNLTATYRESHASFHKKPKKRLPSANATAGAGWHNMKPTPMTEELERDLALIRNRNYLDPKRFYKSTDLKRSGSKRPIFQAGTVVEGAAEFYSSRLTKKQRKSTLVGEVMADKESARWAQQKYKKMQQEKDVATKKWGKNIPNRQDYR